MPSNSANLQQLRSRTPSDVKPLASASQKQIGEETSWIVIDFWPGDDPFLALAEAAMPLLSPPSEPTELAARLRQGDLSLSDLAAALSTSVDNNSARLLIAVDQFEELYTICPDQETRQAFLDLLLSVGADGLSVGDERPALTDGSPLGTENLPSKPDPEFRSLVTVLIALRADFVGHALSYRPLSDAIQQGGMMVGLMTADELRQTVEQPSRSRGVRFETGLTERLLSDVGDDSENLPLLQFCLSQLWDGQTAGTLTHASYDDMGGVAGALRRHAEHTFAQLDSNEQMIAPQTLIRLVQPGELADDFRRWAGRSEMDDNGWMLIQRLADARLVVIDRTANGQEHAALVHEALIRHWERLHEWLGQYRAVRLFQHRLAPFVRHWEESGRNNDDLLRGALLAEGEEVSLTYRVQMGDLERRYIDASILNRDRQQAEQEARQRSELEQARALAESEHQQAESATRARRRLGWMAVGLTVTLVAALVAFGQARVAEQHAAEAEMGRATAEAERVRADDNARAALSHQLAA